MLSPDGFCSRLQSVGNLVKSLSLFPEVFEFYEGKKAARCYVNFSGELKNLSPAPIYDKTALSGSS